MRIFKTINGRKLTSNLVRLTNPGWGHCGCCGYTWNLVDGKSFLYTPSRGSFPICELCYDELLKNGKYDSIFKYYVDSVMRGYNNDESGMNRSEKVKMIKSEIEKEIGKDHLREMKLNNILK